MQPSEKATLNKLSSKVGRQQPKTGMASHLMVLTSLRHYWSNSKQVISLLMDSAARMPLLQKDQASFRQQLFLLGSMNSQTGLHSYSSTTACSIGDLQMMIEAAEVDTARQLPSNVYCESIMVASPLQLQWKQGLMISFCIRSARQGNGQQTQQRAISFPMREQAIRQLHRIYVSLRSPELVRNKVISSVESDGALLEFRALRHQHQNTPFCVVLRQNQSKKKCQLFKSRKSSQNQPNKINLHEAPKDSEEAITASTKKSKKLSTISYFATQQDQSNFHIQKIIKILRSQNNGIKYKLSNNNKFQGQRNQGLKKENPVGFEFFLKTQGGSHENSKNKQKGPMAIFNSIGKRRTFQSSLARHERERKSNFRYQDRESMKKDNQRLRIRSEVLESEKIYRTLQNPAFQDLKAEQVPLDTQKMRGYSSGNKKEPIDQAKIGFGQQFRLSERSQML